jgi:UDP-N-acetylglucosamine diphosphorylase / glucose-1-phosphate thymidylyltransferase / UDP-N-acetylgalactosamine diphosphorylase / glucosamine-1-phosphate N-acetyltransferase / galactosamine-1-phosphate N-acetyltransferase
MTKKEIARGGNAHPQRVAGKTLIRLREVEGILPFPPMYHAGDLFDLDQTEHAALFEQCEYAWEAIQKLPEYIQVHLKPGCYNRLEGEAYIGKEVFIGKGTVVEDGAMIKGPAIIGGNCQIRHNAYIRENVIIGNDCVVGNASELKNVLLFNGCQVSHFNYAGDSILGFKGHLGAGVKISNIKLVPGNVTVEKDGIPFDTGLRKFGALIGDGAEIGCNAVLNPGSIIGRGAVIYPNVNWRGILPANHMVKNKAAFEVVVKRPRAA